MSYSYHRSTSKNQFTDIFSSPQRTNSASSPTEQVSHASEDEDMYHVLNTGTEEDDTPRVVPKSSSVSKRLTNNSSYGCLIILIMFVTIVVLATLYATTPVQKIAGTVPSLVDEPVPYTFREVINLNSYSHLMAPSTVDIWQQIILVDPSTDEVVANFTIESISQYVNGSITIHLSNGDGILTLPNSETLIYTATNGDSTFFFNLEVDTGPSPGRRRLLTVQPSSPPSQSIRIRNTTYSNLEVHVIYLGSNIRIPASVADGGRFVTKNECDSVCAAHCSLVTREEDDPFNPPTWWLCNLSAIPDLQLCQASCPIPCSFVPNGYALSQISPPQWPPYSWTNEAVESGYRRQADYVPLACSDETAEECILPSGTYACVAPPNLNCTVDGSDTLCSCTTGYTDISVRSQYLQLYALELTSTLLLDCRDRDECREGGLDGTTPCPSSDWQCLNRIGGFECLCGAGHTQISATECVVDAALCEFVTCPAFSSCTVGSQHQDLDNSSSPMEAISICTCDCGYEPSWPPNTTQEDRVLTASFGQCTPSLVELFAVDQQLGDRYLSSFLSSHEATDVPGRLPALAFNATCWGGASEGYPAERTGREYCCNTSHSTHVIDTVYSNGYCLCTDSSVDPFLTGCSTCIPSSNMDHLDRCLCMHREAQVQTTCTKHTFEFDVCHCRNGFLGDSEGSCVAVSESENSLPLGDCAACSNLPGGTFSHLVTCARPENETDPSELEIGECFCFPGFARQNPEEPYHYITNKCVDVNECDSPSFVLETCGVDGTCVNFNGSFGCGCASGYTLDYTLIPDTSLGFPRFLYNFTCIDIDECASVSDSNLSGPCQGSLSACINTPGSYECTCRCGYEQTGGSTVGGDPDGPICQDIDECEEMADNVTLLCPQDPLLNCVNSPGSYCCVAGVGYETTFSTNVLAHFYSPTCPSGIATTCVSHFVDVNECNTGDAECSLIGMDCINYPGSYVCVAPPI